MVNVTCRTRVDGDGRWYCTTCRSYVQPIVGDDGRVRDLTCPLVARPIEQRRE